jgi:hypothetical protein
MILQGKWKELKGTSSLTDILTHVSGLFNTIFFCLGGVIVILQQNH